MDFMQLQYVLAVAEHLNVSRAAGHCYLWLIRPWGGCAGDPGACYCLKHKTYVADSDRNLIWNQPSY